MFNQKITSRVAASIRTNSWVYRLICVIPDLNKEILKNELLTDLSQFEQSSVFGMHGMLVHYVCGYDS